MPFVRTGRSIDIVARRQGAAAVAGQHRRRRLAALVGQRPQPLLEQGPEPFRAQTSAVAGAFAGGKEPARRRSIATSASPPTPARPQRHARAHRRAHRHHARRRGDRERHRPDRRQPHRRGRPGGGGQLSRPGTRTIDVTGKTIIPGLIDAHWHGSMGIGRDHPAAELGPVRRPRLRRDHGPRPVQRHQRDFRRVASCRRPARSSARASSRPAPSSTARRRPSRSRSTALDDAPVAPAPAARRRAPGRSRATTSRAASSAR